MRSIARLAPAPPLRRPPSEFPTRAELGNSPKADESVDLANRKHGAAPLSHPVSGLVLAARLDASQQLENVRPSIAVMTFAPSNISARALFSA